MWHNFEKLRKNILSCPKNLLKQCCPVIRIHLWMIEITLTVPDIFIILIRGSDINKPSEFLIDRNVRQCKKKKENLRVIKPWEDSYLGLRGSTKLPLFLSIPIPPLLKWQDLSKRQDGLSFWSSKVIFVYLFSVVEMSNADILWHKCPRTHSRLLWIKSSVHHFISKYTLK